MSFAGLGGIIVLVHYILTFVQLVDFLSLFSILIFLSIVPTYWRNRNNLKTKLMKKEQELILKIVKKIEYVKSNRKLNIKKYIKSLNVITDQDSIYIIIALFISILAGILNIIPLVRDISPPNLIWFDLLVRTKEFSHGIYFPSIPEPGGLQSFIYLYSTIFQIKPELVLNILSASISIMLSFALFKTIVELFNRSYNIALICTILYTLIPSFLMPKAGLEQFSTVTIEFALLFLLSSLICLLRFFKYNNRTYLILFIYGVIAIGFVNIFVLIVISPIIFLSIITFIPKDRKTKLIAFSFLIANYLLILLIYYLVCYSNHVSYTYFIKTQLFKPSLYSFFPDLVFSLETFALLYAVIAIGLLLLQYIFYKKLSDNIYYIRIVISIMLIFSLPYVNLFQIGYDLIDLDQLNSFYSIIIAIFIACFLVIVRELLPNFRTRKIILQIIALFLTISFCYGYQVEKLITEEGEEGIVPKHFFETYYKIVSERQPYTYAIVAPDFGLSLAKDRHFFINYNYLLNEYIKQDSVYNDAFIKNNKEMIEKSKLPESVFVFIENPPFNSISPQVLYNSASIMKSVENWIKIFKSKKQREINIYYKSAQLTVFEIVNRKGGSNLKDLLFRIRDEN